jgi:hypothetical protein
MLLDVTSVMVRGQEYPLNATMELEPAAGRRAAGDVVVAAGTRILFVLPEGFTAARRPGEMP